MSKPRVLFFDIETFPNKGYSWGIYEQNIIEVFQHWYTLSFAWKWLGEKQTYVKALPDYKREYKTNPISDEKLMQDLWKLFDEADVIIGHNGRSFDIKKTNARFAKYGMKPPSPYQIVDTKEVAKRYFKFDSNKLDSLADYFGIGRKLNTGGFALWLGCEKGDTASWNKMKRYNKYDVVLLEKVYLHMLPFMTNHPNMGLIVGNRKACPNCGSLKVHRRGTRVSRTSVFIRYQCQECGGWSCSPNDKEKTQIR